MMKQVQLNTGSMIPIIGLGTWKSMPGELYSAIRWAIKLGYKHFDCAAIYGNEKEVGQALADAIKEGDVKREELFVTSKLWNDAHAAQDVAPALENTLRDLQLDYLDLYLIHWPVAQRKGTGIPENSDDILNIPEEVTWAEMEKLYLLGKTKAIGVSNFSIKKLQQLIQKADIIPAVNQIESHPFLQQKKMIDFCKQNNIAVTAYSPLGSGGDSNRSVLDNQIIKEIAWRVKATPAQVVLAWQVLRGVIVIPKSIHEERLRENLSALNIELDATDIEKINGLDENYRFIDGKDFLYGSEDLWDED